MHISVCLVTHEACFKKCVILSRFAKTLGMFLFMFFVSS